jgi:hypothetical protein
VAEGAVFTGDTGTFALDPDKDSVLSITVMAADYETTKTYTIIAHRKSANAYLKSLTITTGSGGSNLLSPAFEVDRTSYGATVSKSATGVTITATPQSSYATVSGDGDKSLSGTADEFKVVVTSEEGTTATYTIVITYLSNDATLNSIVITDNSGNTVALTPEFNPNVLQYQARTANSPSVTVVATATEASASVDPARKTISLKEGNNAHTITVTAADKVATKEYVINIVLGGEEETAAATLAAAPLTIYPNPATGGLLTIENGDLKAGEQVKVYSIAGSLVATFEASAGTKTVINVAHLTKGAYIVTLGKRAAKVVVN